MKIIRLYGLIFSLICIFFFKNYFAESQSKNQNLKKINPPIPVFGNPGLEWKETRVIQESDTFETYMFTYLKDLSVNKKGDIYLIDDRRVLKYTGNGRFVSGIGRMGQGPGEFEIPAHISICENNHVYISDLNRTLVHIDEFDRFVEELKLNTGLISKAYPAGENFFGITRIITNEGVKRAFVRFNPRKKTQDYLWTFSDPETEVRGRGSGGVMGGRGGHAYSSKAYIACLPQGKICFAINTEYRIKVFNEAGDRILNIILDEEAERITAREKSAFKDRFGERLFKSMHLPSHRPYFDGMTCDEHGRIFITRTNSIIEKTHLRDIDVFSKEGRYIYRIQLPYKPLVIRGGKAYSILRDQDGRHSVIVLTFLNGFMSGR